jgi:uncharacterized protein YfaT (DUF1175 family)
MRPLLRLTFGIAFVAALPFHSACTRTDARADAAEATRAHASTAGARADAAPEPARWDDSDSDGMPDGVELRSFNDRESFRKWFTAIAEEQFYETSKEWNPEQRDCAGLVRFAWRESLRAHDRGWFLRMGERYDHVAPDVRAYTLERSPVGEKLFRTSPGSFEASNLSGGAFSEFADARTLKDYNTRFVGRDAARAEPGDLLFFQQPFVQKYPYHVMLFIGRPRSDSGAASDWVVYHTGSSARDAGEVRLARRSARARHPDGRWRPVAGNRNFLGFYRLKILD